MEKVKSMDSVGGSEVESQSSQDQLEQERGITILAKNAAVTYKGIKASFEATILAVWR